MKHLLTYWLPLLVLCASLWLVFSGRFEPLFLFYGAVTIVLAMVFAYRADFPGRERQNLLRPLRLLRYLPLLLWQIILANVDVVWRIMRGNNTISPIIFDLPISLNTEHGRTLFAQSITLTPGTVAILVYHEKIIVHALSHEGMKGLLDRSFERPALWYENSTSWQGEHMPHVDGSHQPHDDHDDASEQAQLVDQGHYRR